VKQGVEPAGGEQVIQPAEAAEDALPDLAVNTLVVDDEKVSATAVGLGADEHGPPCDITMVALKWEQYKDKLG
jgi:hypothetical protein